MFDKNLSQIDRLFDGREIGQYELPPELVELRNAYRRHATYHVAVPNVGSAYETAIEASIVAAKAGKLEPPDIGAVIEKTAQAARQAEQANITLRDGRERLAAELRQWVSEHLLVILVDCLQPAFDRALEAGAKDAEQLTGVGAQPDLRALSVAGKATWDAAARMEEHRNRHGAIRDARSVLARLGLKPEHDEVNLFGELKAPQRLWDVKNWRWAAMEKPWPNDPAGKFTWLMIHASEIVWLPTPSQQDEQWVAMFGEDLERHRQSDFAAAGWRALLSR